MHLMQQAPELNPIQVSVIRQLALHTSLHFAELNADNIPSDQFSYHLRQLLKNDLIEKDELGTYRLSAKGKSRRVLLQPGLNSFVTQGFIAVRIILSEEKDGEEYFLMQERLTEPYKGTYSTPGNKVSYGEDVQTAARRIMREQTGLNCVMEYRGLVHFKDDFQGVTVQDKYFFVFRATDPKGRLKVNIKTDKNTWLTYNQLRQSPNNIHGGMDILDMALFAEIPFLEKTFVVDEY